MVLIYAHKAVSFVTDTKFMDYLEAAARELEFELWWDHAMDEGLFKQEIERRLNAANVVVCLVTQAFLNSDFVTNVEAKIVARRRQRQGLIVVPVMLDPVRNIPEWLPEIDRLPASHPPYLAGRTNKVILFKEIADKILERVSNHAPTYRETRSTSTLRQLPDDAFSAKERAIMLEHAQSRADHYVPSPTKRAEICREARKMGASQKRPLSKEQLARLDRTFLVAGTRRRPDPMKVRWVLRACGLHPQGRVSAPRVSRA
jgi:hypothetical protein